MCRRRSILEAKNKSVFLLEKTENGFSSPLKFWPRKKATTETALLEVLEPVCNLQKFPFLSKLDNFQVSKLN